MLQVGLTGGLATGKSTVGRFLAGMGCHLIKMDELGHEVIQPGGEAHDAVLAEFGTVDRKALAAQVFSNPEQLARLNAFIHPAVLNRARETTTALTARDPRGIVVTEAAIMIETGSFKDYDRLIVAVCRPEQQIERAMARDGLTRQEVLDRLSRQMPIEDKVKYADFVIDTSGTQDQTRERTQAVYESLRRLTQ